MDVIPMNETVVESPAKAVIELNEKIRVLHVDDDSALLKISKQCMEMEAPVQVDTVSSVDEASTKLEKENYDVVVSDYQMPGKDGLDLLKELRQKGNTIPFIMFTGKGREEVAIRALNLGANQYLNKTGETETVYTELAHNITELAKTRKAEDKLTRATDTLRISEERYKNLFENAKDPIITFDLDGVITSANEATLASVGLARDELMGKNMLEFVAEKDWPRLRKEAGEILQGKHVESAAARITPNGMVFVEYVASPMMEGEKVVGIHASFRDITECKKAEEELRRFSTAVRTSLDGIVTGDLNGNITDVNEAALRMYGSADKSDLIGKNVLDFLVESDRARALHDSMESMKTGQGKTIEYTVLTKNGAEVPVEITTAFLKEKQGEPMGFVDIIRNISERKKGDLALKESEARYRSLVEQSLQGIAIAQGPAVHTVFVNKAMMDIWGYSAEEFYSFSQEQIEKMIHPEYRNLFFKSFKDRLEGKNVPSHYEFRALRKDGSVIWLEISSGLIEYNGQPAVQGIFTDITERKKIEESLRENKEKFAGLFSGNHEATVFTDPSMRILDVNPRFMSLLGYSLDEIKGKRLNDVIVPENLVREGSMLDEKAAEGYVYHDTVRMKKDSSLIPVSVSAAPISVQGQLIGCIGVYKDISQQKSAEKKLAMMNEKLRVIGGLTRHDVRNKLSIITGNAYLNKKRLTDHPEIMDSFKEMESACNMIVRLFDFARDYENLGVEELIYVDVESMAQKAASLFPDLKGVKITNECRGLTVLADSLLRQLFYNLIDNSLKYGDKTTQIRIHYEKSENQIRLIYEDNGVGISQDLKPKIFDEGYTTGKGSGYGLYLIKKMMEVYGWTIQETGELGKGVQFVITVPRTNQNSKENYRIAAQS